MASDSLFICVGIRFKAGSSSSRRERERLRQRSGGPMHTLPFVCIAQAPVCVCGCVSGLSGQEKRERRETKAEYNREERRGAGKLADILFLPFARPFPASFRSLVLSLSSLSLFDARCVCVDS